jgi:hypothetical protein
LPANATEMTELEILSLPMRNPGGGALPIEEEDTK